MPTSSDSYEKLNVVLVQIKGLAPTVISNHSNRCVEISAILLSSRKYLYMHWYFKVK